jgi:L-ectoine synthase
MIVRKREDVRGTKGEAQGDSWRSLRLLHHEDGMGVTLVDGLLEPGFDMILWQKNHLEACYCIEGEGTVEELGSGRVHEIKAGTLYAMNNHDRHRIRAITRMRVICTFVPPLTGEEKHDADGSL